MPASGEGISAAIYMGSEQAGSSATPETKRAGSHTGVTFAAAPVSGGSTALMMQKSRSEPFGRQVRARSRGVGVSY